MKETLIIIPTYNEKDNVVKLVESIFKVNGDFDVLFVDDNSPDGTVEIIEGLAKENTNIKLLVRNDEKGYGRACIDGFRYGIEHDYEFFLQMDADLSHDPKMMSSMIKKAKDYDLVIGSRFVDGGEIVADWSPFRRFLSWGGSKFARFVLGLPVNDCTSGFRCYSRRAIEVLDLGLISSNGYSFLIETLYKCYKDGCKIIELPIIYTDRQKGQSKLSRIVIFEAFWLVLSTGVKRFFRSQEKVTAGG